MHYIALLRGINVGGNNRVEMKYLKTLFEQLKYSHIETYINSGNIFFETSQTLKEINQSIECILKNHFNFTIPFLVKTKEEMTSIANTIPKEWENNEEQKTDIAYLFPEVDSPNILEQLPVNREFVEIYYVKGAIL